MSAMTALWTLTTKYLLREYFLPRRLRIPCASAPGQAHSLLPTSPLSSAECHGGRQKNVRSTSPYFAPAYGSTLLQHHPLMRDTPCEASRRSSHSSCALMLRHQEKRQVFRSSL